MVLFQAGLAAICVCVLFALGLRERLAAFATGAALISFNFFVLAKMVPKLVFEQKGAVFSLLCGFYLRLILTAAALYLAIAWARFPVVFLLAGLSTILVTFAAWSGRFITNKHKEA
jgi:uncharacterized membrane protein YjjP (DUF1212 family)